MFYKKEYSLEKNHRLNKIISLIIQGEISKEKVNLQTLIENDVGKEGTLKKDLAELSNEEIITFNKHKLSYHMVSGWENHPYIKKETDFDYATLGIIKSLLSQFKNTPVYESSVKYVESITNKPVSDFNLISVPPLPEYNKEDGNKFEKIFQYMKQGFKIKFDYSGRWHDNQSSRRIVHPYQLLLDNGTCYLFGYDETVKEEKKERLFVLRRMKNITLNNGEKFTLPIDYEFSNHCRFSKFGAYTFGKEEDYEIEFTGNTQVWINETKWSDNEEKIKTEKSTILRFSSSQDDRILQWILSCGPEAIPKKPKQFVERWKSTILKMKKVMEEN